jgi:hypothetical protein
MSTTQPTTTAAAVTFTLTGESSCSGAAFASFPTTPASIAQLRWGQPPPNGNQAGFAYAPPTVTSVTVSANTVPVFACGELTVFNEPSLGGTIG